MASPGLCIDDTPFERAVFIKNTSETPQIEPAAVDFASAAVLNVEVHLTLNFVRLRVNLALQQIEATRC
ncbi:MULTISPECIES: hypothetical protein [unclassified Paraburkholderia]|uniref:hypothetical protein n=1 Tax=unclassified Paraburkholderia TaxID=2615204 RepID=UPI002AB2264C|nr:MULTISPECIES: hypothetical protein [unclassified Paraburkholderia]